MMLAVSIMTECQTLRLCSMYQIMLAVSIMTEYQTLLHVSDDVSCEHNDRMSHSASCIRLC